MQTINIVAHAEDISQIEAIKAILKALKIKFEIYKNKSKEKPYNPEFVAMIQQGDKDLKEGKGKKMSLKELNDLWK